MKKYIKHEKQIVYLKKDSIFNILVLIKSNYEVLDLPNNCSEGSQESLEVLYIK